MYAANVSHVSCVTGAAADTSSSSSGDFGLSMLRLGKLEETCASKSGRYTDVSVPLRRHAEEKEKLEAQLQSEREIHRLRLELEEAKRGSSLARAAPDARQGERRSGGSGSSERLEEDRANLNADIREVYAEAKSAGFDAKTMRQLIRLRKLEPAERQEQEHLLEVYRNAVGV